MASVWIPKQVFKSATDFQLLFVQCCVVLLFFFSYIYISNELEAPTCWATCHMMSRSPSLNNILNLS